jgi:hypothetical protein
MGHEGMLNRIGALYCICKGGIAVSSVFYNTLFLRTAHSDIQRGASIKEDRWA